MTQTTLMEVPPIHAVKSLQVRPISYNTVRRFVTEWHYGGDPNGIIPDYCFGLVHHGRLIGAMIYGDLAMPGVTGRYCPNGERMVELRRLCCIDDTPPNTESFFIAKTLKWLRDNTDVDLVISYADKEHGHVGTIYKASNFELIGEISGARVIDHDGAVYHDKAIRTKYKGKLKPFAKKLKDALGDGDASYRGTAGKNVYLYRIRRKPFNTPRRPRIKPLFE